MSSKYSYSKFYSKRTADICCAQGPCTDPGENQSTLWEYPPIHYLPRELLGFEGGWDTGLCWTNELLRVTWLVQKEKDIWTDFFVCFSAKKKKSNITADTIYYLNTRLRKGGSHQIVYESSSYIGTGTVTPSLLGNSPRVFRGLFESVWTCLRCMCYANMQYGTEESEVMGMWMKVGS